MQFCICFAIFLGVLEGIDHKNRPGGADFVFAFIDSFSPSPSRTNSFVFVLLYYLEIRNGIAQENWHCGADLYRLLQIFGCTARAKQTVLYVFLYIIVNPRKHRQEEFALQCRFPKFSKKHLF